MPLGYCIECETLRTIVSLGQKWGSRECEWAPIEHPEPPRHRGCGGLIEQTGDGPGDFACGSCGGNDLGLIWFDEVEWGDSHCPGSGKPIR
jgi:hypothetical protein